MTMRAVEEGYKSQLAALARESRLRRLPADLQALGCMVDLSSNDYLGLSQRAEELAEEFFASVPEHIFSSSASRLLSHRQRAHLELEGYLGGLYGKHILLYNSGYHANVGTIQALAIPGSVILSDRLAHASMIDGIRLCKVSFERFRHNDMEHLETLIRKHQDADRLIVITESIFSMDGDEAPLQALTALRRRYPNVLLYLDEAHGFGVRGARGLGVAEESGLLDEIDVLIGTFGKAACSTGAFVATSTTLRDWVLNTSRSFIFSTALPPINMAYTQFIIEKIVKMNSEREHLSAISAEFRREMEAVTGTKSVSTSQIVPLVIGDSARAVALSESLRDIGFDALAIRRPTVPPGGERIRFSLNATLTHDRLTPLYAFLRSH